MTVNINLNSPSYLPSLMGGAPAGDSLLDSLCNRAAPLDPLIHQIGRDLAYFTKILSTALTPARLLADPTALRILLIANGLGDQLHDPEAAVRALLAGPGEPGARPDDPRWARMIQTYRFAAEGLSVLTSPAALRQLTELYATHMASGTETPR